MSKDEPNSAAADVPPVETTVGEEPGYRFEPSPTHVPPAGHDFRAAPLLSAQQLRQLRLRHEEFARSLSTRLSIYFRLEFSVHVTEVRTARYRTWLDGLPTPTHTTLFKLAPLDGTGLFALPPRLALTIIDRLLGGVAAATTPARELSEIEVALIDDIVQLILREWCSQIVPQPDARPVLSGHENNARFLQTAPEETTLLVFTFEAKINDCTDHFSVALPFPMIEALVNQLAPPPEVRRSSPVATTPLRPRWNSELDHVPVSLTAGWEGFEISARSLAHLRVGDLLPLDANVVNCVQVRLAQVPKFIGRLGSAGNARAIELTSSTKT